jgi:hypothetical protein
VKTVMYLIGTVLLAVTATWGQMPNGPGPHPPHVAFMVQPPDFRGGGGTVEPSQSAQILALQKSALGYALLVTASDGAWVSCTVSTGGVQLATGESWVPKGQKVLITLTAQFVPPHPPDKYDTSCIPQFLNPAGTAAQAAIDGAAVVHETSYSLSPEPDAVSVVATEDDWTPSFSVSEPGTLTMVFDDAIPGLAATFDTNPGAPPTTRKLAAPVHTAVLQEGKYYRYHFIGGSASGNAVLAQQNKTYFVYKNTMPQLSTPINLTSRTDGVEVKFGLTREVKQLVLQFPSGVSLPAKSAHTSGAATWEYDVVIPTDLEVAAASIGTATAQGITKSLNEAATTGGTPTATGTLTLSVIDHDLPSAPTIAQFTLSVVRVNALPLINILKAQNPKLGLDKSTATNIANQALGITTSSSQQDKDAASALITLLMQKGNSNFKDSLVTFLVAAGSTVARAYGIPVPAPSTTTPSAPAPSSPSPHAPATGTGTHPPS